MNVSYDSVLPSDEEKSSATAQGWHPPETAPMDGTRILILVASGSVLIGWWREEAEFEYCVSGPGWQIFECEDCYYSWAETQITHWMPLPHAASTR